MNFNLRKLTVYQPQLVFHTFYQHCLLSVLQMINCTNFSPLIFNERSLIYDKTLQKPICTFIDLYCPPKGSLSKSKEGVRRVLENVIALRSWQVSANSVQLNILWAVLMRLYRVFSLVTKQHTMRQYITIKIVIYCKIVKHFAVPKAIFFKCCGVNCIHLCVFFTTAVMFVD